MQRADRRQLQRLAAGMGLLLGIAVIAGLGSRWLRAPLAVEAQWVRVDAGAAERLDPGTTVSPEDCLELEIRGSRDMHVYVLNGDANGTAAVLYPSPTLDRRNPLAGKRDHRLPGTVAGRPECWRFGPGGGEERMLVVASRGPLVGLEKRVTDLLRANRAAGGIESTSASRGVTGLAPSPNSPARSRIVDVVDGLGDGGDSQAGPWVWQVRFANRGTERGAIVLELDDIEMSAALELDDASALTDIALAQLRAEDSAERLLAVVQALELAARAAELEPGNGRACSAHARALERVFLRESASAEWERCLRLESDPSRRARTLERLDELSKSPVIERWEEAHLRLGDSGSTLTPEELEAIVRQFPNQAYDLVERSLLPLWGRYVVEGDPRADDLIARLRTIGRVLQETISDALLSDIVLRIDAIASPVELKKLAAGHVAFGEARQSELRGAFETMSDRLDVAQSIFGKSDSPYVIVADYRQAVLDYYLRDYQRSTHLLESVRNQATRAGYPTVVGLCHWMEGLNAFRQAAYRRSLESYLEGARVFKTLADEVRFVAIQDLVADAYDFQREYSAAWRYRHEALSRMKLVTEPRVLRRMLMRVGAIARRQGLSRVSLAFGRAGLEAGSPDDDPLAVIATCNRLAMTQYELGHLHEASDTLERARALLADLDATTREESAAELGLTEARLELETNPTSAVRRLDEAFDYYSEGQQLALARVLPMRGRANWAIGDLDQAEHDFDAAIAFLESHREAVTESTEVGYADLVRDAYDWMVDFQLVARSRADTALEFAERGRARLLMNYLSPSPASPVPVQELAQRLPVNAAVLHFTLLDDRIVTWVLKRSTIEHLVQRVDRMALQSDVMALRAAASRPGGGDEYRRLAARFYDLLIRPVRPALVDERLLIMIPDKILHLLPFAMLFDSDDERYLVQDFRLALAPTAGFALREEPASLARESNEHSVLVVANPMFERRLFPSLADLAGAEGEAKAISDLYPSSHVLAREDATRSRFLAALSAYDVVHFAGHALAGSNSFDARLLFAPETARGDTGELFAGELYERGLSGNRLVVLAACDTAVGRISSAEGPLNLARPFLAAGVPAVVANLWSIDDVAGARLFVRFHQAFRATGDAPEALREAQISMLESENERYSHPRFWAATQVFVGGGASTH